MSGKEEKHTELADVSGDPVEDNPTRVPEEASVNGRKA